MSDWLATLWVPNWRSFRYYNLYRLILTVIAAFALLRPQPWADPFHLARSDTPHTLVVLYAALIGFGGLLAWRWERHFNAQLTAQVMLDAGMLSTFMYHAGGVSSGLGILLLVSLTAASLVGRGGRLVLFFAATATLCVLGQQTLGILEGAFDAATIVHAGLVSAGFFGTAILARLLGQRVMFNEDLARRRGIALDNQQRIQQRVLERMQDGILVVQPDGRVARHNPAAAQWLAPLSESTALPLAELSPALAAHYAAWRHGPAADTLDFPVTGGRTLRARFEATASTGGEVLIFLEDMARVEAQAQQLKLAALGRLTASIAHEIRNPLAAISHAGELLREERRPDLQARLLRILSDNIGRLDRIVQEVLELGRRERARQEVIVLAPCLREFIEEFAAAQAVSPALIELHCPETLCLSFDRAHLHRVLLNLVGNAHRHARGLPGSVCIEAQQGAGGEVELHVVDDGPGVPAALRGQVFEPFFTTATQGTGLGLFIARDLCAANGARLEIGGREGQGHFVIFGRAGE